MKVLVFGSLNLDFVYKVDHFVQGGETLSASSVETNIGGKGLNQAIAAKRAGADVYFAGVIGQGGEILKDFLDNEGVNTSFLKKVNARQGNAIIQVNKNGENCILLDSGSNFSISEEMISETLAQFNAGDFVLLQNEINGLDRIITTAHEKGLVVVLNPSPFEKELMNIDFTKIDWIILNETEARMFTGETEISKICEYIRTYRNNLNAVITFGSEGAYLYSDNEIRFQKAYKTEAVDTTGAGDTFTGYFAAGLASNREFAECMEKGAIAAGIAVSRHGAAASIPFESEVSEVYEKNRKKEASANIKSGILSYDIFWKKD